MVYSVQRRNELVGSTFAPSRELAHLQPVNRKLTEIPGSTAHNNLRIHFSWWCCNADHGTNSPVAMEFDILGLPSSARFSGSSLLNERDGEND